MFSLKLTLWDQVLIGIFLIWLTALVNLCPLQSSKWVTNIGSISKLIIIIGMFIAAVMFVLQHGHLASEINFNNILPGLNVAIIFIPIIIYNLLGCELISSAAGEMKNPKNDVPKAVIISALAIASLYLITTLLIWVIVPTSQINVSSGIIQMFIIAFDTHALSWLVTIVVGGLVLSTLFTGVVAWTLGENRTIAEAANDGEMPKIFGLINRFNAPVGAAVISAIISTIVILVYWFLADTATEMFWHITAFCLVVNLFAYLILFPAYIALRKNDPAVYRPYKVPGPNWFAIFLAILAESCIVFAVVLLCIQPGKDFVWSALPILVGTVFFVIMGEVLINYSIRKQ
jgi:amino acid transporter